MGKYYAHYAYKINNKLKYNITNLYYSGHLHLIVTTFSYKVLQVYKSL